MKRNTPRGGVGSLAVVLAVLALMMVLIQLHLIALAFESLGLSHGGAAALFLACAVGSLVNIPLFRLRRGADSLQDSFPVAGLPWLLQWNDGRTLVVANLGGAIIPGSFAGYLWVHCPVGVGTTLLATALVAAVSRAYSRVEPGVGVTMPALLAPLSAALIALVLDPGHAAPLAYIGGTLGVLLGADILRLRQTARLGAPVAAIGGAGTFDGVFLTGIVAVLLT